MAAQMPPRITNTHRQAGIPHKLRVRFFKNFPSVSSAGYWEQFFPAVFHLKTVAVISHAR